MKTYINSIDLQAKYNLIIINVVKAMMAMPGKKDGLTTDLKGRNGVIKDLDDPKFKARTFPFNCIITAPTVDALVQNYWAFFSLLKRKGKYTFFNDFINQVIYISYLSQESLSDIYQTQDGGYALTFVITFEETNPFDNIPVVFLVDDNFNVLVP